MSDFWKRADSQEAVFRGREARSLPTFDELADQNVLVPGGFMEHFECEECGLGHVEEVVWLRTPGAARRAYIHCPEVGRVELDLQDLMIWAIDLRAISAMVAKGMRFGRSPVEEIPQRVWFLGSARLGGRTRDVFLIRGAGWSDGVEMLSNCRRLAAAKAPLVLVPDQLPSDPLWLSEGRSFRSLSSHYWFSDGAKEAARELVEVLRADDDFRLASENHVFKSDGSTWRIVYDGQSANFRPLKGFEHLRQLLKSPHLPIEALLLASPDAANALKIQASGIPVSDPESQRWLGSRLAEMREELAELDMRQSARKLELEAQIPILEKHIRDAENHSGQIRKVKGSAESARLSVTNAISRSTVAIRKALPALADHLEKSIRTGVQCMYTPSESINWDT
ncbi:MAG: hypothetical protein KJZ84_18070 [Bryobacteraceae bacterium]|nr:hypothetical protein [Bryobacteraceae bacterium]